MLQLFQYWVMMYDYMLNLNVVCRSVEIENHGPIFTKWSQISSQQRGSLSYVQAALMYSGSLDRHSVMVEIVTHSGFSIMKASHNTVLQTNHKQMIKSSVPVE